MDKGINFIKKNQYNNNTRISTPFHKKIKMIFMDYTASSFPLKYIENFIIKNIYPFYHNTHSNSAGGILMNDYLEKSKKYIMKCINGSCENNKIIFTGNGVTGAINHLAKYYNIDQR